MITVQKIDKTIERLSRSNKYSVITFVLAFFEQSISPIWPESYVALVLSYRKDVSWKFLSFVSACGSTFGAFFTYIIGYFFFSTYGEKIIFAFGWETLFTQAEELFKGNVFITQFLAAFTPLPDRVFSFVAGAFGVSLILVLLATFFARVIRVAIVAYLAYEWGDEARDIIKKHTRVATAIVVALVCAYFWFR